MDNIVAKTIKFFFVPEAALAVLFLLIFLLLFGVGIYWAKNCRKSIEYLRDNAESEYEKVRAKMSPELFIKKYLNKISATEGKLEGVPEAFVSIGIVATFLGLGVAIQGSAELLEDEKLELAKLTAVLGVIAFKFQTSVWGICFSLIFRSFIVERYFDFRQETIDYVSDLLYTIERESIRTLLEKQNEFLAEQDERHRKAEEERAKIQQAQYETLVTENRQLFTSLLETIIDQHEENQVAFERLNSLTNNFLTTFTNEVKIFTDHTGVFVETSQEFSNRVEKFKTDLTDTLNKEFLNLTTSNENLGKLHEQHMEEIHLQHERNIFHVTEKLDELHQKFYLDSKRYVEDTQHKLGDLLANTLDKVNDGYIRESAEISATIKRLNDNLSTIESRVNNVTDEFINRQNQFVNEWRNVTETVTDTLENVAKNSQENSNQAVQTYQNLQAVINSMQAVNAENAKNMEESVTEMQATLNNIFNELSKLDAAIERSVPKSDPNLRNVPNMQEENFKSSNHFQSKK